MPRWSQQNKFRIAERRKLVASLYLQGKFQAEIAQAVSVDRGTVSRDLKAVEAEWMKSGVMDLSVAKARELAKNKGGWRLKVCDGKRMWQYRWHFSETTHHCGRITLGPPSLLLSDQFS
jgi:transposase